MSVSDTERWLTRINGRVGRGSEFRAAVAAMRLSTHPTLSTLSILPTLSAPEAEPEAEPKAEPEAAAEAEPAVPPTLSADSVLTRQAFRDIYLGEVNAGKVWSVSWDLAACGYPLPASDRTFSARYDRIFLQVGGT